MDTPVNYWKLSRLFYFRWHYRTEDELGGYQHSGELGINYDGGGYSVDLLLDRKPSEEILKELKDFLWIRRGTRVVFIAFTVYNANINLFCVITWVLMFVFFWFLHTNHFKIWINKIAKRITAIIFWHTHHIFKLS